MLTVRLCLGLGPNYLTRIDHHGKLYLLVGEWSHKGKKTKQPKKEVYSPPSNFSAGHTLKLTTLRPASPASATWRLGKSNFGSFWHFLALFGHFFSSIFILSQFVTTPYSNIF